jgi:iron complex transport system substrate-binding protein
MTGRGWAVATAITTIMMAAACSETVDEPGDASVEGEGATSPATRVIEDVLGTVEVPAEPERVVVLAQGELDAAIALGVVPVGGPRLENAAGGPLEYLKDYDIPVVGTLDEPNLEMVASLQPDLILSNVIYHPKIHDKLMRIAPTVYGGFKETLGFTWKENFLLYGEALGKLEEAEQMLEEWEDRAAALGEELEAAGVNPEISMVRFLPGETRVYQKENFIGRILDDVGLPRPKAQDVNEFALYPSVEQIEVMEGDIIFYANYGPPGETTQSEITGNPLWQTLTAVQQGCAFEVSDDVWYAGISIIAANMVLDDMERILLEEGKGEACAA